jgi:cytochrome c oxidase subunit 4
MIALRTYYIVFAVLLGLTLLTTGVAFIDLGAQWNIAVALAIAAAKALLVAIYFMHLRHSPPLIFLVAGAGLVWLTLLMVFVFADYLTRGW